MIPPPKKSKTQPKSETMAERAERLMVEINKPDGNKFPPILDASKFTALKLPEPPQIISGVLHQGCKLVLGGGSKTFKSWTLIDLALAVAHGQSWLGFETAHARVCYVNLELPDWSFHSRLKAVAGCRGISIEPGSLHVWNLRGHALPFDAMLPRLADELAGKKLGLLIIDPIYRIYGNADENSAKDVSALLNGFESLARQTGAAVAFASHFAKGNAASKESIDRISGSGVFARDPDAIITFTRHEEDGAFAVDATLRNCAGVEPFVVRWQYPLMVRDDNLNPGDLKTNSGRKPKFTLEMLVEVLQGQALTTTEFQKLCLKQKKISRPSFYRLKQEAEDSGAIRMNPENLWEVSKSQNAI